MLCPSEANRAERIEPFPKETREKFQAESLGRSRKVSAATPPTTITAAMTSAVRRPRKDGWLPLTSSVRPEVGPASFPAGSFWIGAMKR
jgi:hypothetical protein